MKSSDERISEVFKTSTPVVDPEGLEPKPWYVRFQERVWLESFKTPIGGAPSSRELGERVITLLIESAVRLRRTLVWTAPFIGVAYVVVYFARGS